MEGGEEKEKATREKNEALKERRKGVSCLLFFLFFLKEKKKKGNVHCVCVSFFSSSGYLIAKRMK